MIVTSKITHNDIIAMDIDYGCNCFDMDRTSMLIAVMPVAIVVGTGYRDLRLMAMCRHNAWLQSIAEEVSSRVKTVWVLWSVEENGYITYMGI